MCLEDRIDRYARLALLALLLLALAWSQFRARERPAAPSAVAKRELHKRNDVKPASNQVKPTHDRAAVPGAAKGQRI